MKIGLRKKGTHTGGGTVMGISHGSEYDDDADDHAEVTIRHGAAPKRSNGPTIGKSPKRSRVHVPGNVARGLKVGQKVRIHIEPA